MRFGSRHFPWLLVLTAVAMIGWPPDSRPVAADTPPATAAGGDGVSLTEMLDRWERFVGPLESLSREERMERVPEFFDSVTLDDLRSICRQFRPEFARAIRHMVRGKFEYDTPPDQMEFAGFIGDTTLAPDCALAAIRIANQMIEDLTPEAAAALGDTLLFLSDHQRGSIARKWQFELYAARVSSADRVLDRIRRRLESPSDSTRMFGVRIAADSRDPRIGDLMIAQLDRAIGDLNGYALSYPQTVSVAARTAGARVLPRIESILAADVDWEIRRNAVLALGEIEDRATLDLLLRAYGDRSTGIRDSTWAIPDPSERSRYFTLHSAIRKLEPFLRRELRSGAPAAARSAIELIDRAVRFGPMVEAEPVVNALKDSAMRDIGVDRTRIRSIVARVQNPPEPIRIKRGGLVPGQ